MTHWTYVTDESSSLPPAPVFVGLLTVAFEDGRRETYFGSRSDGRWYDADEDEITLDPRVDAWRPMPEPAPPR